MTPLLSRAVWVIGFIALAIKLNKAKCICLYAYIRFGQNRKYSFSLVFPAETKKMDCLFQFDLKKKKKKVFFWIHVHTTKKMNAWIYETDWGEESSILFCPRVSNNAKDIGDLDSFLFPATGDLNWCITSPSIMPWLPDYLILEVAMFLMPLVDLIPPGLDKYLVIPGLRHCVPIFQVKVLTTLLVRLFHGNFVLAATELFYPNWNLIIR